MSSFVQSSSPDWTKKEKTLCSQCLCGEFDTMDINDITGQVIGAAIEVHKRLGPGLLESIYEECLCIELGKRNISFERQKEVNIEYRGIRLDSKYRLDLVVSKLVVVELKTVNELAPIHDAQILSYLKLTGLKIGLLINFNVPVLKEGIKRLAL